MVRPDQPREMSDTELLGRLLEGSCAVDERLLEALLAEGVPAPAALRRAVRARWQLGAALLLGGALALGAARPATAREAAAPAAPAVAAALAAAPAVAPADALSLVAAAPATTRAAMADASLEAGMVLLVPSLVVEAQSNTSPMSQLYTVAPGDTLSGIALRVYGDASYWPMIYNSNTDLIRDPNLIFPGQSLRLVNVPAGGTLTPGTNPGGGQTGQGPGQYTVRPGDSLWTIAQFAYGNPARWIDIYNANATRIGPNPSMIFSGTVLTIPA